MEAEIWQRIPKELLHMILARLPIRVLGKMRTVCKQWKYLLSSRDAFEGLVPIWSLYSTLGFFFIQIHWNPKDDVDSLVIEERSSDMYKVPLLNHVVVNTCKGIFCCHRKGDMLDLSIGIPKYQELGTAASSSNTGFRFQWIGFRLFHKALHSPAGQIF